MVKGIFLSLFAISTPLLANVPSVPSQDELTDSQVQNQRDTCYQHYEMEQFDRAFYSCQRAAQLQDAKSEYLVGQLYLQGEGTKPDYLQAIKWFKQASTHNYPEAKLELGKAYATGSILDVDYKKSFDYFSQAAHLDNAQAQFFLALCYQNGFGIQQNDKKAHFWFSKSLENDFIFDNLENNIHDYDPIAQLDIEGQSTLNLSTSKDATLDKTSDPKRLYEIGLKYFKGDNIAQDDAKAFSYFRKSALQGYNPAKGILSWMNALGLGITENYIQANNWFIQANPKSYELAIKPNKPTKFLSGNLSETDKLSALFETGKHKIEQRQKASDIDQGLQWVKEAAQKELAQAQVYLGDLYHEGQTVPENNRAALKWYLKAAMQDQTKAQEEIGWLYYKGQGVPQNFVEAYAWINLAAEAGSSSAKNKIEVLSKHLSDEQIQTAKERTLQLFKSIKKL